MRMGMRRLTRLTNGFSKKVENLEHAVSLHFMHYNFARVHKTLRVTPAMEAGIANHVWSIEEIAEPVPEPVAVKHGQYRNFALLPTLPCPSAATPAHARMQRGAADHRSNMPW